MPTRNWEATGILPLYAPVVQNQLLRRFEIHDFQVFDEAAAVQNHTVAELRFVIAYDELPAALRAMNIIADIDRRAAGETKWCPLLWKFDALKRPACLPLATRDAVKADLIMISTNAPHGIPPAVEAWIKSSFEQKRGDQAAVVALFGPSNHLDQPGSARLELVRQAAKAANLDFFAPFSNPESPLEPGIEICLSRAEPRTEALLETVQCDDQNVERHDYEYAH